MSSTISTEALRGFVWLPQLPGSDTFCYVVKKAWAIRALEERCKEFPHGEVKMCSLMKVRILEWVDIF